MQNKTMTRLIFILICLNIVVMIQACGPQRIPKQSASISPELGAYLSQFTLEASVNGYSLDASHLSMSFSETMPPSQIENCPNCQVVAYCQPTSLGPNIVFKTSFWNTLDNARREHLAFHELAHCLMDAPHYDTDEMAYDYDTMSPARRVPSSITYELLFDSFLYESNRDTYVKRLFGHAYDVPLTLGGPSQFENIY